MGPAFSCIVLSWLSRPQEKEGGRERVGKASRTITVNEKLALIVADVGLRIRVSRPSAKVIL